MSRRPIAIYHEHPDWFRPLFVELIGTSAQGKKVVLVNPKVKLEPGKTLSFPDEAKPGIAIRGGLGREQVTLFASDSEFAAGQVLRGQGVTDRLVHQFQTLEKRGDRVAVVGDVTRVVKKTLEIETR